MTLKSQFQFQFETSVSVFVHSVAVNQLCISCMITWSELSKLLNHMDFVYFFKVARNDNCSFYMREIHIKITANKKQIYFKGFYSQKHRE